MIDNQGQEPKIIDTRGKRISYTGRLLNYADYRQYSDTFIETGSAAGDGVQRSLDAGFNPVLSCEAAPYWFEMCRERFLGSPVYLFPGKSTEWLERMLGFKNNTTPCVIFLDAHPAGPLSAGHQEWLDNPNGEAAQDNIIQAELRIILAHRPDHVIIIDDVNGMTDGCAEKYMNLCLEANPNYRFEFWDECLSGNPDFYYNDKILVCLPN